MPRGNRVRKIVEWRGKKPKKTPWNNDAPARVFVFLCLKIHREKRVEVMFVLLI